MELTYIGPHHNLFKEETVEAEATTTASHIHATSRKSALTTYSSYYLATSCASHMCL